jgi:hypothetical protein
MSVTQMHMPCSTYVRAVRLPNVDGITPVRALFPSPKNLVCHDHRRVASLALQRQCQQHGAPHSLQIVETGKDIRNGASEVVSVKL